MAEHPEGVDLDSLRAYFAAHVAGAGDRPLSAELIAGGRSNLTYGLSDGEHDWVLRRPPLGHVIETAHDMGREYRVLSASRAPTCRYRGATRSARTRRSTARRST